MRAIVNEDTCIGCTLCVQTCPEVFRMEGEKAVAAESVKSEVEESVRTAAEQCPVDAIALE